MRERGLEPLWCNPLDPKSSASASSATLACLILQGYPAMCQTPPAAIVTQPIKHVDAGSQALRIVVRIPLRHHDALVAEQLLHLVGVDTLLNQPRGEGVPQIVKVEVRDPEFLQRFLESDPKASHGDRNTCPEMFLTLTPFSVSWSVWDRGIDLFSPFFDRSIRMSRREKSTSFHTSARISPRRMPVWSAVTRRGLSHSGFVAFATSSSSSSMVSHRSRALLLPIENSSSPSLTGLSFTHFQRFRATLNIRRSNDSSW
jgi:hypothetical protein